jgi:TatD DNase family protein
MSSSLQGVKMIFDSHAHYDDKAFDDDRHELLGNMPAHDIDFILNAGSSLKSLKIVLELTACYPFVYGALGVHPSETAELTAENLAWMKEQCENKDVLKVVAIGEIGLDYYWDEPAREIQKHWFVRQLSLAKEESLPVIIHSREAAKDTLDILRAEKVAEHGGVMHCFAYTKETARECLEMNLYIGIGGVVTFKNAQKMKEVVAYTPLERILIETDSPYLAPVPYRGKRNSSAYLSHIAREIAAIKEVSYEKVVEQTRENAMKLFRLTV